MELNNNEEYIGDYWQMRAKFNLLFDVIHSYNVNHQNQLLDYYNNFRVEISYPKHIKIKGKFIIGKTDRGEYKFDSDERDDFRLNDFLKIDGEQVKSSVIVVMMGRVSCEPLYFFDDFLQANEMLENDEMLLNAKYWRIPPKPRKSCKEFVQSREKFKNHKARITIKAGTRKKKRIMRTQRKKRNKRTRRTKLR
jgi:hypothetical protein